MDKRTTPRRPLVLLLMAAAIPMVLFAGWAVFLNARQNREDVKAAALETLDRVVTRVSSELNAQMDIAETLASSSALDAPDLAKFYLEASRVKDARPLWETIALIDPKGNQIINLLRPMGEDLPATTDVENLKKVSGDRRSRHRRNRAQSAVCQVSNSSPCAFRSIAAAHWPMS